MTSYTTDAVTLLKRLIATPRISRDEKAAADIFEEAIRDYGYQPERLGNNIWIKSQDWDDARPTIMLNAHIDTVKPVATWTRDPFTPSIEDVEVTDAQGNSHTEQRLYGLGSNDCGGGLVSLLQVFRQLSPAPACPAVHPLTGSPAQGCPSVHPLAQPPFPFNLLYLASCEEEVSGKDGIRAVLPMLPPISVAIVGEPTGMQPAIAERGLMVIDGIAHGKSGHAARSEGINAINEALDDLLFLRDYQFEKVSPLLGPTKMQCTVINAGTQHNVVPDECRFVIDVRTNEHYTNEEVFQFLQSKMKSELTARSFHLHSSSIPAEHPLIQRCIGMGMKPFGSPTLSDQALMRFPSFKLGPGQSSRSHSADEYICLHEIEGAIERYIQLLDNINL